MSNIEHGKTRPTPNSGGQPAALTQAHVGAGQEALELDVGQRLGPFELRQLLGSGGMGQVFLAEQMEPVQRAVALKFMHHRLSGGLAPVRFEIERQALARMSHPAIAQVFEAGTTADGYPYLAMEYVPGEPIDDYCRRRQLGLRARLELYIRVALGVQHAHQKSILHLDLKPANLLVTEVDAAPQPKIIDFGLAASAIRAPGMRSGAALAGTPGYMSPEQAGIGPDGANTEVDIRSDVYALGVVLYQLLADASPFAAGQFSAASTEALRRDFAEFAPLPVSARLRLAGNWRAAAQVTGDLDAIVAKAMAPSRDARYDSVGDLIDDLRRYLEQRPVSAWPATRSHRFALYLRRHRVQIGVTLALTLTLLLGLAAATYGLIQARHERDQTAARERELERVSEFQQSMLADLDPAKLGISLQQTLRTQLAQALVGQADAKSRLDAFDRDLALANATEAARQMLDADLLARALQAIERELSDQPLVAAELQMAIARAYRGVGRFDAALKASEAALARFIAELGPEHPKALDARWARSDLARMLGQGRELLPQIEQVIAAARLAGASARGTLLQMQLLKLEIIALDAGQLAPGTEQLRALVPEMAAHFGNTAAATVAAKQLLANLIGRAGKLADATPLWRSLLAEQIAAHGELDNASINTLMQLGANLDLQGKSDEALPLLLRALDLRRQLDGNEHPATLQAMNSASVVLSRNGRLPEAIELALSTLALRERTLGPMHPQTLRSQVNLGAFYARQGDIAKARELTRLAYERRRATLGPDNLDVYLAGFNLAEFELIAGDPLEGLRLATEAMEQRSRLLGAEHLEVARARAVWLRAMVVCGRYAEALPSLEEQLAAAREDESVSERELSMRAWYLARAYLGLGREEPARALIAADLKALQEASFEELNPPEREALRQYQVWQAAAH